ncbi:DUF4304 domain-containing protein [Fusobacterium necrophorum]|uniref:DUF4304 domain-containing protein n=2 Tax=Fusobacterium necrophorum TaxID=859 RepID=A0AB73BTS7_9FUSO|nr:DUF4304 domain-containing protein [Fusobacterium necrophorum]AYZ73344.1 DUF4304 domain-containing protein [Fusobacterium necrophorum]AZW08658.1 DUF4304 domain-containing protein [Fusobacterium necrophorum subsp. necrophorum]KDE61271.1 hypothetical protein FUSO3_10645 [Fusobacterium necrophorum BL]SDB48672.1 protein of unknown function [Fusobacterium necrophorum]SQD09596.1 Uncharacterised protein [Fusobacterium necrophorum subsp. necrophorum]
MEELTTKEFHEIYKKYFKEYFDKPLKKDGYYKKGSITFYKVNKLMMIETINFQRHYDRVTVNFGVSPLWCGALKGAMSIGGRINVFSKEKSHWRYQWWDLRNEEEIKNSMAEILELIQTGLYKWFKEKEEEENIIESLKEAYFDKIHEYMFLATAMAKFKRYDEILPYIEKVKEEYKEGYSKEERDRIKWLKELFKEVLLLEEKVKEGHEAIDDYIVKRERQSLMELGLEKLIKD